MAHKSTNEDLSARLINLQKELGNKLINGSRSLDDLSWFNNLPKKILRQLVDDNYEFIKKSKNPYLRLVSRGENLTISACKEGEKANISNSGKTFLGSVVSDLNNYGINTPQPATMEVNVAVYEMHNKNGSFKTLFTSLDSNLKNLAFESQKQIEKFAQENKQWLRTDGYGTFFLFTENVGDEEKFFVADVFFSPGGLEVDVDHLSCNCCWNASDSHRIVVPVVKKEPKT